MSDKIVFQVGRPAPSALGQVASIAADVERVSADSADVQAVAADLGGADTIGTVAADLTGAGYIAAVGANLTEVQALGTAVLASVLVKNAAIDLRADNKGSTGVSSRAIAYGRDTFGDGFSAVYYYDAASTAKDDGWSVIKEDSVAESTAGRWIRQDRKRGVILARGQSQMQRNANTTVQRVEGGLAFPDTLEAPFFTVSAPSGGFYNLTFEGEDPGALVRVFRPGTGQNNEGPLSSNPGPYADGLNSVAVGYAYAKAKRTGQPQLIVQIAEGSQAIERFLESSRIESPTIVSLNPLTLSVSDVRLLIVRQGANQFNTSGATKIDLVNFTGLPTKNGDHYYAVNTSFSYTNVRGATSPLSGTFEVHDENGAIDATGAALGTNPAITAHHLLDLQRAYMLLALADAGETVVEDCIDVQGEANAPPSYKDVRSTVGGVATPQEYMAKRKEWWRQDKSEVWYDPDRIHYVSYELLRDNNGEEPYEKPRNDVIGMLADLSPRHAVASSAGYYATEVNPTHIDDRNGWGYWMGDDARRSLEGGNRQPGNPYIIRRAMRPDFTLGRRDHGEGNFYDEATVEFKNFERAGRSLFNDTLLEFRSSRGVLPGDIKTNGDDLFAKFRIRQSSASGVTPGYSADADPNSSRIISEFAFNGTGSSQTFIDRFTGTSYTDVFPITETDIEYEFTNIGSNEWEVTTPARPAAGSAGKTDWTPTISGQTTTGTNTYTVQDGHIHAYGDARFIEFKITVSGALDSTGNLFIAGLPENPGANNAIIKVTITNRASGISETIAQCASGSSQMRLMHTTSTGYSTITDSEVGSNVEIRGSGVYFV